MTLPAFNPTYRRDIARVTTKAEAARLYAVDPKTVQYWIDAGFVVARKAGGVVLVSLPSLTAYRGHPQKIIPENGYKIA